MARYYVTNYKLKKCIDLVTINRNAIKRVL